jgi:hypothetical protein
MTKCNILSTLLFNSLLLVCVPGFAQAAFEAPEPQPVSFALANLNSFPDYLTESTSGRWCLHVAASRLYGMPEIQPFGFWAGGNALGGGLRLRGYGLNSGTYQETSQGLEYRRFVNSAIEVGLEAQTNQIAIEKYGSAWAGQVNGRLRWTVPNRFTVAFTWINATGSSIGTGNYPLPGRLVLGGRIDPQKNLALFLEVEKTSRYDLSTRIGAGFMLLRDITLLGGFQSDPNLAALGVSALIGKVRAIASYQYHSELGFSQCYGIGLIF